MRRGVRIRRTLETVPSRPARPEPRPSRAHLGVVVVAVALVGLVLVADTQGVFENARGFGMVLAIAGAALAAGTTYSFWAGAAHRTARMHAALVASMIGGAGIAASASSGVERVFAHTLMGGVGLAGLALGAAALVAQDRTGAAAPSRGNR